MPYGLIAGNGRFPLLALEVAKRAGLEVVAIGIKEEASPEIEPLALRCHWISLGALSKLIDICHREGVTQVMMCGQVKHAKIFSSIVPDLKLVKLLAAIETRNTEGLIGGVMKVLKDEGIELVDSTLLLKDLLAPAGVLTGRRPSVEPRPCLSHPGYQRNTFPVRLPMNMLPFRATVIQCPGLSMAPKILPVARSICMIRPASVS